MTFIQFMTLFFFNLTICGSSGYDLGNDVSFSTSELCYEYFLTHDSMSLSDFYLIANRALVINGVSYSSDELVYSDKLIEEWKKYCENNGIAYTDPTPLPKATKPDTNKGNSFAASTSAGTFYFEDDEDDEDYTPSITEVILSTPEPEASVPATIDSTADSSVISTASVTDSSEANPAVSPSPIGKKTSAVKKFPVSKPVSQSVQEDEEGDDEGSYIEPTAPVIQAESLPVTAEENTSNESETTTDIPETTNETTTNESPSDAEQTDNTPVNSEPELHEVTVESVNGFLFSDDE